MKTSKKLLILLICLFLLFGCSTSSENGSASNDTTSESEDLGLYYLNQLKNYEVREKDSTLQDNAEFNAYLDQVFLDTVSDNYLFMIQNVDDYKALEIEKPEVSLGHISYDYDEDEVNKVIKQLDDLLAFDYNTLSLKQQYDYDMYHYSLLETLCGIYYDKYGLIFSESNGFSENLMTVFMEINLDSEEDEQDFLKLLALVPEYVDEAINYCDSQMENGLFHSDEMLNTEIDYLNSLIENNCSSLSQTFMDCDIANEIDAAISDYLIPSFTTLRDYLKTLLGKSESALPLCKIDQNYAEYIYLASSSNNESIDTMFDELVTYYTDSINAFVEDYQKNENLLEDYETFINQDLEPFNLSGKDLLEYLRNNTSQRYEYLDDISYTVSELDTLGSSTAGYFVVPPVDNPNRNVIRINTNSSSNFSNMELIEVLAHEGFPGHLYENAYYQRTNPHPFRSTNSFLGYTEGYADLASMDAISLLNFDDESYLDVALINSLTFNNHVIFSIIDLGVNYYGWDLDTLSEKLEELGLSSSYASYFYDTVISMPGVFTNYGLGFISHLNLRNKAIQELGDKFDYVEYSNTILENGALPFAILKKAVENYINENK